MVLLRPTSPEQLARKPGEPSWSDNSGPVAGEPIGDVRAMVAIEVPGKTDIDRLAEIPENRKHLRVPREVSPMPRITLVAALTAFLIAPAFAQQAEIDAVNAKWIDFFNKGDFSGIASLYTEDATAFPPGSAMVKGRPGIEAMWKDMAEKVGEPKLTTLDVKALGPSAVREIGTFSLITKGSPAAAGHRQISRRVGEGRKRLETRS